MATVGIRELKMRLSYYLRRVQRGERIVVTARARPVAILGPAAGTERAHRLERILRTGKARWDGGKPRGDPRPGSVDGPSVADAILEDRG